MLKSDSGFSGPPPDWVGLPPSRGSEVFVGKIPRDCFEDELVPVKHPIAHSRFNFFKNIVEMFFFQKFLPGY
jgi:hypothetical protein